jgi:rubrerythrin
MTPLQALAIALDAERRAHAFFERVYRTADDPALRALAQEMMTEESEHIAVVQHLLQRCLEPLADCSAVCDGDCC